jgi:Zn-dependent M28 family amino/carboxypeptidase
MRIVYLAITAIVMFTSCGDSQETGGTTPVIDTVKIKDHIRTLASDEFMGRKPFTEGEIKTINYLKDQFEAMGVAPGNGQSYFQEVPLVELTAMPDSTMKLTSENGTAELQLGVDYVAYTERVDSVVKVDEAELVFAGYGVVAPEYNWNDYEGLDMEGKIAVVMVNDPGFSSEDPAFFKGRTMTYYGRWTYKYEEAARQGAAGVMIIHETVPAGYPWTVVKNSWSGASLYLDSPGDKYQCAVQGWITRDAAIEIFELSEEDMRNYGEKARTAGFKPQPLGVTASITVRNKIKRDQSQNVIAMIEGSSKPDEYVIYSAHWDHLGVGPAVDGDSIYNGAHDNASGTAALLAIAEAFSNAEKPERSLVFLAVTAEEQGLLGSKYYAENPIYPPSKTVANINMDGLKYYGRMKDFTIVGYGQSELDDYSEQIVTKQGRYVKADPEPGKGYFFRSDHFSFAKVGIPSIFASGVYEAEVGGVERVSALSEEFNKFKYHQPADEFDQAWLFGGIHQDAELFYELGARIANDEVWPRWKEGSEFKSIREESMKSPDSGS